MVDTKILPTPEEVERKRTELSPTQKIERAVLLAAEHFKALDNKDPSIEEVRTLIEQNWEVFNALVAAMHNREPNPDMMKLVYQKFFVQCRRLGLNVVVVSEHQMPDPRSLVEDENYAQLDVEDGEWVLKFEENQLKRRVETLSLDLVRAMAHEFMAWRLFSQEEGPYQLRDKVTANKSIKTQDNTVFQTHFFDLSFTYLAMLNQPQHLTGF